MKIDFKKNCFIYILIIKLGPTIIYLSYLFNLIIVNWLLFLIKQNHRIILS